MFDRSGEKIMGLSVFLFIIMIIGSIVGGIILLYNKMYLYGIITFIAGIFGSWIMMLFSYGFGELIERTTMLEERVKDIQEEGIKVKENK